MASDYLDYENNLAFPPQEIKSQDDIKHQDTRSSDVLIKTIEKCEKFEKQLDLAVMHLELISFEYGEDYNLAGKMSKRALQLIKELDK